MQILLLNGPNLNLLGVREPEVYGKETFTDYFRQLKNKYPSVDISCFQSNVEGELIDKIHEVGFSYDGIILNAGAYTHTSRWRSMSPTPTSGRLSGMFLI